jgi:hypothetical protein
MEETMKKLALFLVLLMVPCTAFGLEMLTDDSLQEVTGQSGVSIAFDDMQLFLNVDRFAYIDCDGYSTNSNYGGTCQSNLGGAFVIEGFQMDMLNINMIGTAGYAAMWYEGRNIGAANTLTVGVQAMAELNALNGYTAVATMTNSVLAIGDSGHIRNGVAYSLDFVDNGTRYYRNPGKQNVDITSALGYNPGSFTASVYTQYTGSLPLASATCGSIPLFYDYGDTTGWGGCNLSSVYPGSTSASNNRGLNHYINTNNISSLATFHPQAVTIDVTARLPLHTTGLAKAADPGSQVTIGGVLIGLPTAEFHIQEMHIGALKFTAEINTTANQTDNPLTTAGTTNAQLCKNSGADFGTIVIEGVTFSTFGGWMEIAPTEYTNTPGD